MKTKTTRLTGILLTLVMLVTILGVFTLSATAAEDLTVSIDTGTSITLKDNDGDGYYDIGTADEMYAFAALVNGGDTKIDGELTADITVNTAVLKADGTLNGDGSAFRVWTPIGDESIGGYGGDFEGNGKTISGLYFNDPSVQYVGFIGNSYGSVQNLTIKDSYFSGSRRVGGIAGCLVGHVSNCVNYATVVGSGSYAGGIIGYSSSGLQDGTISNCINYGAVSAIERVGGIAGNYEGPVTNCANHGTITASTTKGKGAGGIIGSSSTVKVIIKNCYNTGSVTGYESVGGIVGVTAYSSQVHNSVNRGKIKGDSGRLGIFGEGCASSNSLEEAYCLEGSYEYRTNYPFVDVILVTEAEFASGAMAYVLGEEFGQNIDNGQSVQSAPVYGGARVYYGYYGSTYCDADRTYSNHDVPENPVSHDFTGVTDGICKVCDHGYQQPTGSGTSSSPYLIETVGNLYWFAEQVNEGKVSIHGKLGANITVNQNVLKSDLTLNGDGSSFRKWTPIGNEDNPFRGTFDGAGYKISGLYYNDTKVNNVGLFGYTGSGTVKNVTVVDTYFNAAYYVGGIIGYSDATVQNSSFNGSVNGYSYVGGIVGTNKYQIVQCTSFGYVTGTYSNIGGVAGENSDDIISCTNYSTVTGTNSSSDYIGGITGYNNYVSSVANCHNSGAVSGATIVGGLVGRNDSTVKNSYNTGNVNGKGMIGGVAGYNTGKHILSCYNTGTVNGTGSYVSSIVGDNESTISLCYYLDTCGASGTGTAKTAAQFASGEVAFLLGDAFGQDVTTGEGDTTVDALPVFAAADGSNKLYRYSTGVCTANAVYKYANEETADQRTHDTSLTAAEHYNSNGTCKNCGTQAAASLTTADETPVVTYYMTLEDAITAAQGTDGSTITLLDDVQLSTALSITSNKFTINLNGHNVNAANGATLSNLGDLTITGSGSYNGKIENRGTMVINANVDGEINTYGEKLTVIGGTIQSLIVHGEDIVSLKGGTFDNLKVIVNNPGYGVNNDSALKCLNKLLANGKVYSHYSTNLDRYNSEGYIHFGDDVARFDAWFASPVSVLEDDPVIPTISTQPVGADYTVIDTAEALSVTATNNDDGGTLSYQWYSDTDDDAIGGIAITDATEATYTPPTNVVGTVYYYCVVTNSKTGFDSESTTSSVAKVTITKATPTASDFASILPITPVYDGEAEEIDVTTADGIVGMGQITVWYKDADRNRLTGLPTNAGTYYVYIDVAEGDNYEAITELEIGLFTIEKATPVLTAPTAIEDLLYNGEKLALVNAGSTTGGTLRYGVIAGEYNSGTIYGPVLEEAIPTATDAGSYIVFYMVEGGDNYEDVAMQHITVTIGKATPTITVSASLDKVMPGYVIDITGATDAVDNSLNPTTFTVVDGEGYSVSGNTITIDDGVKIGSTITVKMISTETKNFLAGEGTITLTIGVPSIDTSELEKKIEELEAKLDDLDATFATDAELKAEVDALKAELQALKEADTKTAEDIKAIDEKIAALDSVYASKAEFLAAVARLDDLTKNGGTIEQINAEIKKINDALSALNAENRLDAAEASLDTLINTTIPAINALISDNAYDIGANTADIAKLKNTLANVQQTLTKLSTEDVRLASLISTLETELDALSDSLDTLAGRVDTAEKDIAALKAELATKYAELRGLIESNSNDIASINDTLQDINSILGTLATQADVEAEVGILTDLIDDLTDRIEANEGNIGANINAISALQSTVRALQATVASQNEALEQSISSLSSTLSVLETRIAQNEQNISALNTDLKKAIEDLNKAIADGDKALADEIDALEKALDNAKAALEKADADNKAELISKIDAADAALDEAIKAVQKNLDDAKAELNKAIADGDKALSDELDALEKALDDAKASLEKADADNKAELISKIEAADAALDEAIKAVQKNLDDAKAELNKAIADGDKALSDELDALEKALDDAKATLEKADADNKAELIKKIESADAALDEAIKAVQKNLDDAKAELNKAIADGDKALSDELDALEKALDDAKATLDKADADNKAELIKKIDDAKAELDKALDDKIAALEARCDGLQTFIIIVCIISAVALCGCVALAVFFIIDKKKKI